MIYLLIYFVGIFVMEFVNSKLFPFKEGDFDIDETGMPYAKTEDDTKFDNIVMAVIWPIELPFLIMGLIVKILSKFYDNIL